MRSTPPQARPGVTGAEPTEPGRDLGASDTLPGGEGTAGGQGAGTRLIRGTVIGRYVILSFLGAGGMGAVYAAHDPELDRKVALKVLRSGANPSEGIRLLREARALAKLAHPNVVAIHDVGTVREGTDAEIFIAMEFVEGETAREWLARERPLREVVAVFVAAARGLAAAHRAGLVHRDFKPENMMIGADGRARVMDFGLARPVDGPASAASGWSGEALPTQPDVRLTRDGSLIGTPSYMAPEQWEGGGVDARTDQFALCVALWEAVHGERPFRGDTLIELMSSVTQGTIARPREARKKAPPTWLTRALERGLSRAPERRFPTIDALIAELERGQARERRRPLLVAAAGLGLAAAGALGLQAQRAAACEAEGAAIASVWDAGTRDSLHAAVVATGAPYAEATYQAALPRIEAWAAGWSAARTQVCGEDDAELQARAAACLDEEREGFAALLEVLTTDAATSVEGLATATAELPRLEPCTERSALARRAGPPEPAMRERVGALRRSLLRARGRFVATRTCEQLPEVEALLVEAEGLGYRPLVVRALGVVAELAACAGSRERAEEALRRAYVEAEALGSEEAAADAAVRLVVVIGEGRARAAEALQWGLSAEVIVRRLGQERGLLGARLLAARADVLRQQGELDAAQKEIEAALAIREAVLGPEHPLVASTLNALGNLHRNRESYDSARALQTRALAIRKAALGADHPFVASVANNLALLEQARGDYEAARGWFAEALRIHERAYGPEHLEVAKTLNNFGRLEQLRGDYPEALRMLTRALAIREARPGHELDAAYTLQNLGLMHLARGARVEARAALRRALAIRERKLPDSHPELVSTLADLGTLEYRIGDYEEALALHQRALEIRRRTLKPESVDVASSLRSLALVREARGEHALALSLANEALALAEHGLGGEHPEVATFLNTLGQIQRRDDPAAAVATLERALAIAVRSRGRRHAATAMSMTRLGEAYLARGSFAEAQASLDEALSIRESVGKDTPEVAEVLVALGELALARERPAEAVAPLERALEIRGKDGIPRRELAAARLDLSRALRATGGEPARVRELATLAAEALAAEGEALRAERAAADAWLRSLGRG